jgi:hypothetical protein
MPLVKGPFRVKWGDNVVEDISEISYDFEVDTEDYPTVDGRSYTLNGAKKMGVTIQLLRSDIPALAALLPQYFIENGGIMSTGETVNNADGAIDLSVAACDASDIYNHLDIESCGTPAQVTRLVNCRTEFETIDIDDKIQQVSIRFIGEPAYGEGLVQFFRAGSLQTIS